jgi:hypothetical protein
MSLTTDSKAIAATMPSCRSVASRWRAPNRMVNMPRIMATYSVLSWNQCATRMLWACSRVDAR